MRRDQQENAPLISHTHHPISQTVSPKERPRNWDKPETQPPAKAACPWQTRPPCAGWALEHLEQLLGSAHGHGLGRNEGHRTPGEPPQPLCEVRCGVTAGTHQEAKLSVAQEEDGERQPRCGQLLHGLLQGLPKHGPLPDEPELLGSLGPGERRLLHGTGPVQPRVLLQSLLRVCPRAGSRESRGSGHGGVLGAGPRVPHCCLACSTSGVLLPPGPEHL